jgi:hypothetical protein
MVFTEREPLWASTLRMAFVIVAIAVAYREGFGFFFIILAGAAGGIIGQLFIMALSSKSEKKTIKD